MSPELKLRKLLTYILPSSTVEEVNSLLDKTDDECKNDLQDIVGRKLFCCAKQYCINWPTSVFADGGEGEDTGGDDAAR